MIRRHYVVSYDISDDKRRTRVFKTLLGYGDHAQFSVFFCALTGTELANLRHKLRRYINERQDQVLIVDLGPSARPLENGIEAIGLPYRPEVRVLVV